MDEAPEYDIETVLPFRKLTCIKHPDNGGVSYACIGSTRSGKSTAMVWLWEHHFKKSITLLYTNSSHASIYKPLKAKAVIVPEFSPDLINECMKINVATKNHYSFCQIFDDCVNGKQSAKLQKLLTIGRNAGQNVIYNGQEITMLNSIGRTNINYILCFALSSDMSIEKMIRTWLRHSFPPGLRIHEMIKLYKDLTKDHHCIVVNTLDGEIFRSKIDMN
jgi:hypothetical protein